jgi:hypothetical protein
MNMSVARKNLLSEFLAPLLLTMGTIAPLFYQVVVLSSQQPDNFKTFFSFSSGLDGYYELKAAWRTRLFSNLLAWFVGRLGSFIMSNAFVRYITNTQAFSVALWTALWFGLISLVYIFFLKRRAVFYILGTYAAITFGYMPKIPTTRIYPWDMPALFIFTLFLFLFLNNKYRWILLLLPLAMGFKETAGILCVAFLLANELSTKDKWRMFLVAFVLCILVKLGIDFFTKAPLPFFTMETGLGGASSSIYLIQNLNNLGVLQPYLINAGTLLSFFILWVPDKKIVSLKILALLFALGNFLFGAIIEYRIWFELIPFALYTIEVVSYPGLLKSAAANQKSNENATVENPETPRR